LTDPTPTTTDRLALVLGGTRSGKSTAAERLVTTWAGGGPVTYVATALLDTDDASLAARVAAHRRRRPSTWSTVDAGADLAGVLSATEGTVLLDALGPWVAAGHPDDPDVTSLVEALRGRRGPTVVVSEEVGLAVHPPTEAGRWFVDAVGTVNQAVAAVADPVWLVVAGRVLPLGRVDDVVEP
jgi:adenosyl cobinamide kinase/adenosyl cobinamide phosphate guanylyltransferase